MPTLILETEADSRFSIGGTPFAAPTTAWPHCNTCGSPMQFLAQLPTSVHDDAAIRARGQTLFLFQCQANPGLCDEWEADLGGNAAVLTPAGSEVELPVPTGNTLLPARSALEFRRYEPLDTDETPDDAYDKAYHDPRLPLLGKIGGRPLWIQGDATPKCACGLPMLFFAQLEDRGGGGINFGDTGAGYAFVCQSCTSMAKFLWQCC